MSTQTTKRREAVSSRTGIIAPDDRRALNVAAEQLAKCIQSLRIAAALFDKEGTPTAEPRDVYCVAKEALDTLDKTSWELFSVTIGSSAWRVSQSVLIPHLYDAIDVLTLVCFGLKAGQFPPSNGVTNQPVAGAISVVSRTLPKLHTTLTKYIEQVVVQPARRSVKAASGQEARS